MEKTLWLPVIALFSCFSYASCDAVIVCPLPSNDNLQKPGMGITNFQRSATILQAFVRSPQFLETW
ncbi:MAG TPA: hypothetical protein VJX16_15890 [Terriglobales bacterium]|nr:hypothetical protein [Terriglobales bacterium]